MKQIRYAIIGIVCAAALSCTSGEQGGSLTEQACEPLFTMDTRAFISANKPEDGSVFKLVTYTGNNTTITNEGYIYTTRVANYAYDKTGGTLVPIEVTDYYNTKTVDMSTVVKDRDKALHLLPYKKYRVGMIFPALDWRECEDLGSLGELYLDWKVWASLPDDANGDGTADDPFEIEVNDLSVHPVPGDVRLYPLQSEIRVIFYTTKNRTYKVESISLVNAGINGFYSARTGRIYPNYNYADRYVYSSTLKLPDNDPTANRLDLSGLVEPAADLKVRDPADGELYDAQYQIERQPVFQSDYRGTLSHVLPMTLAVRLDMSQNDEDPAYNSSSIPIAINVLRNKRYTFYIDVQSTVMYVNYVYSSIDGVKDGVSEWEPGGYDDDDLGVSPPIYVGAFEIERDDSDWTDTEYDETVGGN